MYSYKISNKIVSQKENFRIQTRYERAIWYVYNTRFFFKFSRFEVTTGKSIKKRKLTQMCSVQETHLNLKFQQLTYNMSSVFVIARQNCYFSFIFTKLHQPCNFSFTPYIISGTDPKGYLEICMFCLFSFSVAVPTLLCIPRLVSSMFWCKEKFVLKLSV